jgi:Uma2 family endonuclease
MQTQTPKRQYTPEEYLQLEQTSEFKNEYRDGEILPMAGGTTNFPIAPQFSNYLIAIFTKIWIASLWIVSHSLSTTSMVIQVCFAICKYTYATRSNLINQ